MHCAVLLCPLEQLGIGEREVLGHVCECRPFGGGRVPAQGEVRDVQLDFLRLSFFFLLSYQHLIMSS